MPGQVNQFYNDSVFHIETDKIKPNPYQPRREFSEEKLRELADSIKQYGVLQPLVVTRKEMEKTDGGLAVEYELIAGERRLRAARLAGLFQVPVVIRNNEEEDRVKLELAIIENLQREDLNPVDRALAFKRLVEEFYFKHNEIAKKVGKSREYVSNSLRLLTLSEEILKALSTGSISEGHTRPLLMLVDRPEEQMTLFREITLKKMTVREAEGIARRIAFDRVRKKDRAFDPELVEIEEKLKDILGTRVQIDRRDVGGKLVIDYFSNEDLRNLLEVVQKSMVNGVFPVSLSPEPGAGNGPETAGGKEKRGESPAAPPMLASQAVMNEAETPPPNAANDDEMYSVRNFSI